MGSGVLTVIGGYGGCGDSSAQRVVAQCLANEDVQSVKAAAGWWSSQQVPHGEGPDLLVSQLLTS